MKLEISELVCIYQEVATSDSQLTCKQEGGARGGGRARGGNIIHICLNLSYITSGAQRRADNIYFYPRLETQSGAALALVTGDTWGLLNNYGILIKVES